MISRTRELVKRQFVVAIVLMTGCLASPVAGQSTDPPVVKTRTRALPAAEELAEPTDKRIHRLPLLPESEVARSRIERLRVLEQARQTRFAPLPTFSPQTPPAVPGALRELGDAQAMIGHARLLPATGENAATAFLNKQTGKHNEATDNPLRSSGVSSGNRLRLSRPSVREISPAQPNESNRTKSGEPISSWVEPESPGIITVSGTEPENESWNSEPGDSIHWPSTTATGPSVQTPSGVPALARESSIRSLPPAQVTSLPPVNAPARQETPALPTPQDNPSLELEIPEGTQQVAPPRPLPPPPAMNAPHRKPVEIPQVTPRQRAPAPPPLWHQAPHANPAQGNIPGHATPGFQSFPAQSLNLEQPPSPENRLGAQGLDPPTADGHKFWEQFSTMPPDDKKARTEGYDSLQAVLNNGFWFGTLETLYLEPVFQENHAFVTTGGGLTRAVPVDFGFDLSWRGQFGFETNAGPAVKLVHTQMNTFSALHQVTIGAGQTATTTLDLGDSDNTFVLGAAANVGSRLSVQQQIKLNATEMLIYKDQKNPVSRVRGNVGLKQVTLQQQLFAGLQDPVAGATSVINFNDYFGVGPKIGIEYFRPIGHTDLELHSGLFGSLLFGRRDQTTGVAGATSLQFHQIGKVETLSVLEMFIGVQWNFEVARCQHVFVRSAIESQLWANSDTGLNVASDLGLYGASFGFGITR